MCVCLAWLAETTSEPLLPTLEAILCKLRQKVTGESRTLNNASAKIGSEQAFVNGVRRIVKFANTLPETDLTCIISSLIALTGITIYNKSLVPEACCTAQNVEREALLVLYECVDDVHYRIS